MNKIICLNHRAYINDSRIQRTCLTLEKLKSIDQIIVVAAKEKPHHKEEEKEGRKITIKRLKLFSNRFRSSKIGKVLITVEWNIKSFIRFKKERPVAVHCNDFETLFSGLLFKIFCKSKIIYDAHELETEKIVALGWTQIFYKFFEKILINFVDHTITVSPSIKKWYQDKYNLKSISLVRNIPKFTSTFKKNDLFRNKFNINSQETIFIYQGLLGENRSVSSYLEAFTKFEEKHLILMGRGPLKNKCKKYSQQYENIHYQDFVPPSEIVKYTSSADVGFSLLQHREILNHFYALPNKLFEYIHSGVAIIANNFPDMGGLVKKYQCGWTIDKVDSKHLYNLINKINKTEIEEKKINSQKAAKKLTWKNEEIKLLKAYSELL